MDSYTILDQLKIGLKHYELLKEAIKKTFFLQPNKLIMICIILIYILSFKWNGSLYIYPRSNHSLTHLSVRIMLLYPIYPRPLTCLHNANKK